MQLARAMLLAASVLALAACSQSTEPVLVRIQLKDDLSGSIAVRGLGVPTEPNAGEAESAGVEWRDRVALYASSGTFASLSDVRLAGIGFSAVADESLRSVRVTLARGAEARWVRALAPLEPDARRDKAATFDPSGGVKRIGHRVSFELVLPGDVLAHGVGPRGRGLAEDAQGKLATLTVPVDLALEAGDAIDWQVSWVPK